MEECVKVCNACAESCRHMAEHHEASEEMAA
jgi:hypothetical protein